MLSLLRAWVQSLVRELRSYKLHGVAKKKKMGRMLLMLSRSPTGLLNHIYLILNKM